MTTPDFRDAETGTSLRADQRHRSSTPQPRTISNLIVDQTDNNPAAVAADDADGDERRLHRQRHARRRPVGAVQFLVHPVRPVLRPRPRPGDQGRQRHGVHPAAARRSALLDRPAARTNFMVLTRATNQPGPDGILGTADDVHEHTNTTTPFVDQNQTYTSHPSHQVFLREYVLDGAGKPVATGRLIENRDAGADGDLLHGRRRRDRRPRDLGRGQGAGGDAARHRADATPTSPTCRCSRPTPTATSCRAPTASRSW